MRPATVSYDLVDVFTDRPYAGNPLAVVPDADGLSTEQCQAIAGELNLSETTFVLPTDRAADYRLRIFTPAAELPFAGHPSVGTAWVQRRRGAVTGPHVVQDCPAGLLPLTFRDDGTVELTGGTPTAGERVDAVPLARAAGLDRGALESPYARAAGTGTDFTYVRVREEALAAARPSDAVSTALEGTGGCGLYLFSWQEGAVHARMFAPGLGVSEDPATGSAATGLGAWLAAESLVGQGISTYVVRQGAEMGRPSTLLGTVVVEGGSAVECRVAGHVAPVGSGEVAVPPQTASMPVGSGPR